MLLNPFRFGGAGSFGLDAYTANLWGAYSIAKLLSSATDAITAVNTNTSGSATIGFSGDTLDTAALATLSGGTDTCVVSEYLNQEGTTARKLTAAGSTRPRIVNAGVYDGKLVFDGSDDAMVAGANSSGSNDSFTIFIRGLLRSTGTQIILEHSADYNSNDGAVAYYDAGALSIGSHYVTGNAFYRSDFAGVYPNNNVHAWKLQRGSGLGGVAASKCFVNGSLQTRSGNGDLSVMGANFAATLWYLAARAGTTLPSPLDLHTLLIYEGAVSDADIAAISAILLAL